jgi:hypothetical protein
MLQSFVAEDANVFLNGRYTIGFVIWNGTPLSVKQMRAAVTPWFAARHFEKSADTSQP